MYAHVVGEDGVPGKLALQYWFFYPFNDFNNTHEGDWEMIQLLFDAASASGARTEPVEVGYSSHEGASAPSWDDEKLELWRDRPVVYPAAGSHANKYGAALWLGSSAEAGVGCDDTRGPHRSSPLGSRRSRATRPREAAYPWIAFEGRWGELQKAFFNGPTGPNLKTQWTRPITWSEGWSDRSYAVPTGGALRHELDRLLLLGGRQGLEGAHPAPRQSASVVIVLATVLGLVIFAAVRATWTPVAPTRIARRRAWGQIVSASARMYVRRPSCSSASACSSSRSPLS